MELDRRTVIEEVSFLINEFKSRAMQKEWLKGNARAKLEYTTEQDLGYISDSSQESILVRSHVDYERNRLSISRDTPTKKVTIFLLKSLDLESPSRIVFTEQTLPNGEIKTVKNNQLALNYAINLIEGVPVPLKTRNYK